MTGVLHVGVCREVFFFCSVVVFKKTRKKKRTSCVAGSSRNSRLGCRLLKFSQSFLISWTLFIADTWIRTVNSFQAHDGIEKRAVWGGGGLSEDNFSMEARSEWLNAGTTGSDTPVLRSVRWKLWSLKVFFFKSSWRPTPKNEGWDSFVHAGTRYCVECLGFETWWRRDFSGPIHIGNEALPASCEKHRLSFPGVKRPGRGVNQPLPSNSEVKERVPLYPYPYRKRAII